ncbi:MAG: helix-turn-helix domain-containing protein [Nitrospira sp. BO4]|nr:helix-turn-helix domain-containing protein [Nitrospira sp. BO4]
MTQSSVAQSESGAKPNPSLDTLRKVGKALKCTISELVE